MMRIKTSPDNSRVFLEVNGVIVESRASVVCPTDTKCRMVNELGLAVIGVEGDDWKVVSLTNEHTGDSDLATAGLLLEIGPRDFFDHFSCDRYETLKRGKRCELVKLTKGDSRVWAMVGVEDTLYFADYWSALAEFVKQEGRQ